MEFQLAKLEDTILSFKIFRELLYIMKLFQIGIMQLSQLKV